MPKRRDLISMTEEEMWKFIESRKSIQVATINKDGSPHLTTLWFAIEDGKIVLETFTKSQKVVNLRRDARISALLEAGEAYDQLQGVSINGTAELISNVEDVHRLHMAVLLRNTPEIPEDVLDKATASMASKKTAILIKPEKVMSWDHTKLGGIY
ncbi:MAG: pyridoxamine 5'-phosphate oxidase family protein [Myxococcota bacterium]|nr:pyridoxamine 5'-phosphate oxidase family protein [Myxococcota bacterium]